MVFLKLEIKAELENVTDLAPSGDHDFEYFFKVICNSCHEEHPKYITLKRSETRNISNSRGSAHLVWRCGNCKKESSASFVDESKPYSAESNGQFATLLKMECRGLEFKDFAPKGRWTCKGKTGTNFSDVDLEEDDWVDYDEKAKVDVRIFNIESRWTRA